MKFDNPKNHAYFVIAPEFLNKKLSLQELFLQKKRLPRYDRVNVQNLEKYWNRISTGTYIGTTLLCINLLVNSDLMMKVGPSHAVLRLGMLALGSVVLSDVAKVHFLYDLNREYLEKVMDYNDVEVYNPYRPE